MKRNQKYKSTYIILLYVERDEGISHFALSLTNFRMATRISTAHIKM